MSAGDRMEEPELSAEKDELLRLLLEEEGLGDGGMRKIPPRQAPGESPLSFAQQRLWFLDRLEPGSCVYNVFHAQRIRGALDMDALRMALDAIVARHEVLRTTFVEGDSGPIQVIAPARSVELPVVDLEPYPQAEREAHALDLATGEARRPFDLSRDLMLRARLIRLEDQEHVLLLVLHHIASDGWSTGVLRRELAALYEGYAAGCPARLPALPIQYADYATWQRERLQGDLLEEELQYWRRQLAGAPAVLDLPTDRPRPAVQSFRGASFSFLLPATLAGRLKTLAQREEVTLFMVLLAAFQTLLHRYTGLDDIVVGSPIAGRTRSELEGLIGFFVNTLVLRGDLSGDPTFRGLLRRVRAVALEAYAHQDLPFEKLVEEVQPARDRSYTPLVQVFFAVQNVPEQELALSDMTVSPLVVESGTAKFDLSLYLRETAEGIEGSFEYSTDLFEAATIGRWASHFQTLLEGVALDPDRCLSALPLLTESERRCLLVDWNTTQAAYPSQATLGELFDAQAARTPDTVALMAGDARLTYAELQASAEQLAGRLRSLRVGRGVRVGVCLARSPLAVVGLLGVLKAGGAYVPLDPTYPRERLAFMLEDSGAPVLLTERSLVHGLGTAHHNRTVLFLDELDGDSSATRGAGISEAPHPDDAAYVIYTSGSTGVPKGVLGTHRGAVNRFQWMWEAYPFRAEDVCCQKTSLSFVDSVWEIFGPLLAGVPAVIVPDEAARNPPELVGVLSAQRVTRIVLVPSLLEAILDCHDDLASRLPRLGFWVSSGEALSADLTRRFHEALPAARLINLYGQSEGAGDATCYETDPGAPRRPVPIGRPIANMRAYILDRAGQPVPIGVSGELHIGGAGLALGYLNQPELTAEKFIADPFSAEPGARLYKTGDRARYLPDGNIEFLGRQDQQVKIRGFRVEPGEIEAALGQYPGVRDAVVVAPEDNSGGRRLVAYVVAEQEHVVPAVSELRGYLREKLPEYMVPAAFVTLAALPLTPNGKVDRAALLTLDATRKEPDHAFVAPRDEAEARLALIWEELLGIRPVGVTDSFFDLGGHSLLAVRLLAEIKRTFDRSLPLASLFPDATIERLARDLNGLGFKQLSDTLVPIQPHGARPPIFCVHGLLGDEITLSSLGRRLGPDQPFYSLQARGLDGIAAPVTTIPAMAATYIAELRTVQPVGPYLLGGYSFGSHVAFEMARQLRAAGQDVALLAIIDTPAHVSARRWAMRRPSFWWRLIVRRVQRVASRHSGHLHAESRNQDATLRTRARLIKKWLLTAIRRIGLSPPGALVNLGRRELFVPAWRDFPVARANWRALEDHVTGVYPGRVTLLHGVFDTGIWPDDPTMGWRWIARGGVDVRRIPGVHIEVLKEPHVQILAAHLRACLDEVLAEPASDLYRLPPGGEAGSGAA